MGLTFIAAGVSVPDALSGIAVVKEGHGDMAVSNAIGSNVLDILICLGLPWFLDTAIVNPDEYVKVGSKGKNRDHTPYISHGTGASHNKPNVVLPAPRIT